jgi:large repetitive protein
MHLIRLLILLLTAALVGCPSTETPDDDDDAVGDDDDAVDDDDTAPSGYSFTEEEGGPTATFCLDEPPAPPAGGALCTVEEGGNSVVFTGIVLGSDEVFYGGQVAVEQGGDISCVGCDCADSGATQVVCPFGVLSPGLINAHDHISFIQNHPEPHGDIRYQHRHDWRRGNNGHQSLSVGGGASNEEKAWGELRFALTGGTSINGSGFSDGILRNLDSDNEGLGVDTVRYETFPLDDTSGFVTEFGCDYPGIDNPSVLDNAAYAPHIAEGIDRAARNEMMCLSSELDGGEDLIEENTAVIHAVGITAAEAAMMASDGSSVIWSPRSNVDLYGNTAPVTLLDRVGVNLALGTDWTASGSMNVLRELACADYLNREHYGSDLGDWQLWRMATEGGAEALGVEAATGSLRPGRAADIALFDGRDSADEPFRAVLEAGIEDVWGTWRGGEPLAGEADLIASVPRGSGCEELPMDVCGERKRVCLAEVGDTFAALEQANSGSYDLFSCDVPDDEPSCEPYRDGEYDGATSSDQDGDGVDDGDDNCPSIFNPVRLLDIDGQADSDADGVGDVCDPCPIGEDDSGDCVSFDPDDRDADGTPNDIDNCPVDANFLQNDTDMDGLGDICDPCPLQENLPGENCSASIYELKQGFLDEALPVRVSDLMVTAVGDEGFFAQVAEADRDSVLGASFSGVYVYAPADEPEARPAPGDLVSFDGNVNEWFGQIQLEGFANLTVHSSGNAEPAPLVADASDLATGGSLADPYEGVLVRVEFVEVLEHDPAAGPADEDPTGSFVVSGGLRVNDFLTPLDPRPAIGDEVSVTGLLRFANDDSKMEPRTLDDVQLTLVGDPELASFGPAQVFLYDGDTGASTIPPLVLTLDRPAPAGGWAVSILNWGPDEVGAPTELVVPEGETSMELLLDALTVGDASLEALLAPNVFEAEVSVLAIDHVPGVAGLSPLNPTTSLGIDIDLTVSLDAPAPAGGVTVLLEADPGVATAVPASVDIAEGDFTATFALEANDVGLELITATIGDSSASTMVLVDSTPPQGLVITEVLYDQAGGDDGGEWVELWNDSGADLDLSAWSIGGGGSDWTYSQLQLSGTMPAGACWVVGGPDSTSENGNPVFDLSVDIDQDLQNSGSAADGVALFNMPASSVTSSTLPVGVVLYGSTNSTGLIGPDGNPAPVHVGDAGSGSTIEMGAGEVWAVQGSPTPGDCTAAM